MSLLNLDLPLPPSVNHLYCQIGKRRVLSKEGKVYHKTVAALIKAQVSHAIRAAFPWKCPVSLSLYVTFPDKRCADVSNRIKCLEDSLKLAGVYEDDSQVTELHAFKKYEKGVARVYVMAGPVETAETERVGRETA